MKYLSLALLSITACSTVKLPVQDSGSADTSASIEVTKTAAVIPGSVVSSSSSTTDVVVDSGVDNGSRCPDGMVNVVGEYCPQVEQICLSWLDTDKSPTSNSGIGPMRCAEFKSPTKCLSSKRNHKDFCIDKYEFPNVEGALPPVGASWYEAKNKCESLGKRLCTDSEWTFTCEGSGMKPYPYGDGYHRNEAVCDQTHSPMPVRPAGQPQVPRSEWPKYYPGHASGSFPDCKSEFGVYDLVAGIDEWVRNEHGTFDGPPYISGLKGGYSTNLVRTRCRPMTDVHGPTHSFYQQGGRCCRDVK